MREGSDPCVREVVARETHVGVSAYASVVGAEWDVRRLSVTVEQSGGVVATYRIETACEAFNRGDATAREYGDHVRGTFGSATPTPE